MMINLILTLLLLTFHLHLGCNEEIMTTRQRRYLLFTPSTQFGVFATLSVPLPDSTVSVAWFIEANYYNVDNATYFEPLLGDILTNSRRRRSSKQSRGSLTRSQFYFTIERMLQKHYYPGRPCLLRAICGSSTSHFLHNGLLGDLIHVVLTPSTSSPEDDLEDCYYEAEYYGLSNQCGQYSYDCPEDPLEQISELIYENSFQIFD